jgi:flagella basal body P-ring formation protein FlgA
MMDLFAIRSIRYALVGAVCTTGGMALPAIGQDRPLKEPAARIELRPQVTVEQTIVTLGAVADISSRDPQLRQRLMDLPLGRSPPAGEPVTLGRETLMRWIRARIGIDATQIAWSGAAAANVLPVTRTVAGERIAHVAQDQLQMALAQNSLRGEINLLQGPQDITVPDGKVELKARSHAVLETTGTALTAGSLLARRQSVWVDIWVDGNFIRTVPVGFNVSAYAPAYVALQDLAAGIVFDPEHVDQEQLAVKEVEWSGRLAEPIKPIPDNPFGSPASPPRKRHAALKLRRPVAAGHAVTKTDVVAAPLVAQGDYATLRSVNGPIELESRVEVLQDGNAGQAVRVKMPKASSPVLARVTGPGQVEIQE